MAPVRHEGDKKVPVDNWGSHVDQMIREAQRRGEFDNLPGAGKPLHLEDSPFGAEWQSAFRMAKNAGAAPLWVQLDKEIGEDTAALQAMLERTTRYLQAQAAQATPAPPAPAGVEAPAAGNPSPKPDGSRPSATSGRRRWWPFGQRQAAAGVSRALPAARGTPEDLEAERLRARRLYLARAAELDQKILDYNTHKPRHLSWLEKPRLLPQVAAQQFDAACPPLTTDH